MKLAEMTWPELRAASRDAVVLMPCAACEQHGPFLPFHTDTVITEAVAARAESELGDDVLLLPTQWLGASQHHLPFGALTADVLTHIRVVEETAESILQSGFRRLFVLNGHGGNADTVRLALRRLDLRHPQAILAMASYWDVAANEIAAVLSGPQKHVGHACEVETSLLLYLRPDLVRRDQVCDDPGAPAPELQGVTLARSAAEWGRVGGDGYATYATAQTGERLFRQIVSRVVAVVRALRHTRPDGRSEMEGNP